MYFPALFSLIHLLTARWQHCFAPKLKKEVEKGDRGGGRGGGAGAGGPAGAGELREFVTMFFYANVKLFKHLSPIGVLLFYQIANFTSERLSCEHTQTCI
jgi:hypothetical protein